MYYTSYLLRELIKTVYALWLAVDAKSGQTSGGTAVEHVGYMVDR